MKKHRPRPIRPRETKETKSSHASGEILARMAALPDRLPIVCIFGAEDIRLYSSTEAPEIETRDLNCLCFPDDRDLEFILMSD